MMGLGPQGTGQPGGWAQMCECLQANYSVIQQTLTEQLSNNTGQALMCQALCQVNTLLLLLYNLIQEVFL